jgi:LysM repeat protein
VQDVLPLEGVQPSVGESAQPDAACVVKAPDGWSEYVIKPGDNLTVLAQRGETTIDRIVAVNCLDSTDILAGAVLLVPAATVDFDPTAKHCQAAVPTEWVEYTVKPGDNLSTLAVRGGTTVDAIMANNCLGDTTIWVGETLYLPPAAD